MQEEYQNLLPHSSDNSTDLNLKLEKLKELDAQISALILERNEDMLKGLNKKGQLNETIYIDEARQEEAGNNISSVSEKSAARNKINSRRKGSKKSSSRRVSYAEVQKQSKQTTFNSMEGDQESEKMLAQLDNKREGSPDILEDRKRQEEQPSYSEEFNQLMGTDEKRKQEGKGMQLHDLVYSNYKPKKDQRHQDLTEIDEINDDPGQSGASEPEVAFFEVEKKPS